MYEADATYHASTMQTNVHFRLAWLHGKKKKHWMEVEGTFQSVGGWNFYRTPRKFAVWWMVVET